MANRQETLAQCHFPRRRWILGPRGPRVSPLNTKIVKLKAGQKPWSDLRSKKWVFNTWEGPVSVKAGPCHPERGLSCGSEPGGI